MRQSGLLRFAACLEAATGVALMAIPKVVVSLLLGSTLSADAMPIARVAGFALLGLGLASWPVQMPDNSPRAARGLLAYNGLVALYFGFLGIVRHVGGLLLWPAVALHAVVALLLLWTWRTGARNIAPT